VPRKDLNGQRPLMERARASLLMLAFGLGVLGFLVAIERPQWFVVRLASGTARAMSMASDAPKPVAPVRHGSH
jgi:hypothetical protein